MLTELRFWLNPTCMTLIDDFRVLFLNKDDRTVLSQLGFILKNCLVYLRITYFY